MINLFNIPNHIIDTSKFSSLIHDKVVSDFETEFAHYVGAKYACFANSASSLIYLSLKDKNVRVKIPSMMPSVVPNAIVNSGNTIEWQDDTKWVGKCYHLCDNIWDSAQEVSKNQFVSMGLNDSDVLIFSFYPTKPVSGCDGGMVVSNNKYIIDHYRTMVYNGANPNRESWGANQTAIGYKMHGTSIQALIAQNNFKNINKKNLFIGTLRQIYNKEFNLDNTSYHLYRIHVKNNVKFIEKMKEAGIQCGIHYRACHENPVFKNVATATRPMTNTEKEQHTTVSIPFHEGVTANQADRIINYVKRFHSM